MADKKQVIIIGGGFAGLNFAKGLDGKLFDVKLIDQVNHHQFQPLFYQVASSRIEPSNISFPFRKIFQRAAIDFVLATVSTINPISRQVFTDNGNYTYDLLVIASGCKTNFFGNTQLEAHALTMKSTYEAIHIRNSILLSIEKSAVNNNTGNFLTLVIVGAGPTGVELAGAFAEMKKNILPKDYPHLDFSGMKIMLIEGSKNTLNQMSPKSQTASKKYLTAMGVELMTETYVKNYDGTTITLNTGKTIECHNLIWAAGVTGNLIAGINDEAITKTRRYIVDRHNKLVDYANIYALGDIAYMQTEKYPNGHPQLANVAINQGKLLAKNFNRQVQKKPLIDYEYKDLGSMATIGKHKAVVELPFLKFSGYFAWFVWMFLHLMLILSVRNKLMIFINWAWNYLTNDNSLRLILKGQSSKNEQ